MRHFRFSFSAIPLRLVDIINFVCNNMELSLGPNYTIANCMHTLTEMLKVQLIDKFGFSLRFISPCLIPPNKSGPN